MEIFLQIAGGLALLFFGGEWLVRGATSLAAGFGLPTMVIGLTVVAYGTSAPELVISAKAAWDGFPDLAMGNVVGSNIANILLVLGVSAVISPIAFHRKVVARDTLIMLAVTVTLILMGLDGSLSRLEGWILIAMMVAYTVDVFRKAKKGTADSPEVDEEVEELLAHKLSLPKAGGLTVLGIALLVVGADVLIQGSVALAQIIGISEAVIGLTIVAVGTSAPELATSVIAAWRKESDVALGNVIGSNMMNIFGVLGITAAIAPVHVSERFLTLDFWLLLGVTLSLVAVLLFARQLGRGVGWLYSFAYIGYTVLMYLFLPETS